MIDVAGNGKAGVTPVSSISSPCHRLTAKTEPSSSPLAPSGGGHLGIYLVSVA